MSPLHQFVLLDHWAASLSPREWIVSRSELTSHRLDAWNADVSYEVKTSLNELLERNLIRRLDDDDDVPLPTLIAAFKMPLFPANHQASSLQ
jgi:hypothetical protein